MKSALVTGASGFIGYALVEELDKRGWAVISVVRDEARIEFPDKIKVVRVDGINGLTDWDVDMLKGVDIIFHLAARAHILKENLEDPLKEFNDINVAGTVRLAQKALEAGVKRFVYVSSIGVNGNNTSNKPFSETDEPDPHDPYAISKMEAENRLKHMLNGAAMEYVIIRPPLVYGPGNPGNFMRLIKLVDSGLPLPLKKIKNNRSLIYLGNMVDVLIHVGMHKEASNNIYLVSDGEDVSICELVDQIGKRLGKDIQIIPAPIGLLRLLGFITRRSKEVERLVGSLQIDSYLIQHSLKWRPPFSFSEGLDVTLAWYMQNKEL